MPVQEGRSLPVWECGLKSERDQYYFEMQQVTPCVGVWIEILSLPVFSACCISVTPCVGVWIEIMGTLESDRDLTSHSLCGSVD